MSLASISVMLLLGFTAATAFVLQLSKEEPAASAVSHHRCQGGSLQSIRKDLLQALNLQAEPQLPAGGLDGVREQWRNTFSSLSHRAQDAAAAAAATSGSSANSSSVRCCSMASEVSMTDLRWDSWVLHPASLSIVQCAACSPAAEPLPCPPPHTKEQEAEPQAPCCRPTSQETVPVLYVDEFSTLVISSVQLTRSCGCGPGNQQQPGAE